MCALVWIVSAFPPQLLSSRNYKPILTCSAAEPGRRLYDAAYAGDVAQMKVVLAECKGKPDQLNWASKERYGRTPLVIACYYNRVDAVKLLLSTPGVDVNKGIDFGTTALMYAAHRGHADVVKVLLADRRTNINARGTGGRWAGKTALKLCTELRGYVTENSKVADLLRAKGAQV